MSGKCIILSTFLLVTFFRFSDCKVECYTGCTFDPSKKDTPDLKTCPKKKCEEKENCVRTTFSEMAAAGAAAGAIGDALSLGGRKKRLAVKLHVSLECSKDEQKDCGKVSSKGGICVCKKDLCNLASNIIPNHYFLLAFWSFTFLLKKGMNAQ